MGSAVTPAVAPAVPSAVPATGTTSVAIDTTPQRGPFHAATGATSVVPEVPASGRPQEAPPAPEYAGVAASGSPAESGGAGAPTVPAQTTALFRRGPVDPHYAVADSGDVDPYKRVNSPPTRGRVEWLKTFANHVFLGKQNVDNAGWQVRAAQQRTSYMRMLLPPVGDGYSPQTYTPRQMPEAPHTYRFGPVTGSDAYGSRRVLNRDTPGAGQTAGGQGGNLYSPTPGPPDTSTASSEPGNGGMPVWG